ncbi:MAG: diguanylate cyclase [Proteobacteria bacterium]|jgi:diguanylate cyclase (GGDEF)-like protein|nr:diguanylate cyclase [Pseudomonadota bacterium]
MKHLPLVVIVDDDAAIRDALQRLFRTDFECVAFESVKAALDFFKLQSPMIALVDFRLPDGTGLEILDYLKNKSPHTLRVMLTGTSQLTDLDTLMEASLIQRFFLKPWDNQVMRLQIKEAVAQAKMNQQILQLENESRTDAITGLLNRRSLERIFFQEMDRAKRHQRTLSLLLIDVDSFKQLNDRRGHPEGDHALQSLAQILVSQIRSIDFAARIGGDEFAVLLPDTPLDKAKNVAERILKYSHTPSVSIGLAGFPENASEAQDVWNLADKALLTAKQKGKNQLVISGSKKSGD